MYYFDQQNIQTDVLLAWFVGAAGGGLLGAVLNANWSKILIYVRNTACVPICVCVCVRVNESCENMDIGPF